MRKITVLIFVLFFAACAINDTNYRYLTKEQRPHFVPFNPETFDKKVSNNPDSFFVQEITPQQLRSLIGLHRYTCVFLWPDWCSAESCTNLKFYQDLEQRYIFEDLKFIIIALAYDYMEISRVLQNTQYQRQLYVIKYQPHYGYNITRTRNMFTVNFTRDTMLYDKYYSFYLFKDTTLIYSGRFCNQSILDSIFKNQLQ